MKTPQTILPKIFAAYIGQECGHKALTSVSSYRTLIAIGGCEDKPYIMLNDQYRHLTASYIDSNDWHLLLTPLSLISDADAIEVAKILGLNGMVIKCEDCIYITDDSYELQISFNGYICLRKNHNLYNTMLLCAYDYLRSIGYALPFTTSHNGKPYTVTVEDMVSDGFVKLKKG